MFYVFFSDLSGTSRFQRIFLPLRAHSREEKSSNLRSLAVFSASDSNNPFLIFPPTCPCFSLCASYASEQSEKRQKKAKEALFLTVSGRIEFFAIPLWDNGGKKEEEEERKRERIRDLERRSEVHRGEHFEKFAKLLRLATLHFYFEIHGILLLVPSSFLVQSRTVTCFCSSSPRFSRRC